MKQQSKLKYHPVAEINKTIEEVFRKQGNLDAYNGKHICYKQEFSHFGILSLGSMRDAVVALPFQYATKTALLIRPIVLLDGVAVVDVRMSYGSIDRWTTMSNRVEDLVSNFNIGSSYGKIVKLFDVRAGM